MVTPVHPARMAAPYDPANPLRCVQVDYLGPLAAQLRRIEVGTRLQLVVRKARSKHSRGQDGWLFGRAYPVIAREIFGYDYDEFEGVKEHLHYHLLGLHHGTVDFHGTQVPKKTLSGMDTGETSEYMEWLQRWAAREHGVDLPLPDER